MGAALPDLKTRLAEVSDLGRAAGVLGWDQRVTMPPRGTESRAEQLSTLVRLIHERFTDAEVGRLLDAAEPEVESLPYDSDDRSLVRVTRRDWEKARRVPAELRAAMTLEAARGHQAWVEARRNNDFASFLPYLRTNVELKRRYVECFEWSDSPYTPLLDDYEPGMLTTEVREVFATLRPALTEIVASAPEVDASFLRRRLPARRRSARFASAWSRRSASRTARGASTRQRTRSARRSRTATCGSRRATARTISSRSGRRCTRRATGCTRTESPTRSCARRSAERRRSGSTSRRAARGRTWSAAVSRSGSTGTSPCRRCSPSFRDVELDSFVRAINRAEPGLIRVDADETTYSLHIILRFELEQEIVEGTVALEDLPEIWNARMKEFLGVDVPSDADGVLQDVHWSGGGIGYFPTYALGNVISLQIWDVVASALPDLDAQLAAGELLPLSDWLRDNLYSLGRKLTPKETIERADRVAGDRPGAVPRIPARQGRGARRSERLLRPYTQFVDAIDRANDLLDQYAALTQAELPPGTPVFDAHIHLGEDIDGMVGDRDELLAIQRAYGVTRSFVFCLDEPDRHPVVHGRQRAHVRTRAVGAGRAAVVCATRSRRGPRGRSDALYRPRRRRHQAPPTGAALPPRRPAPRARVRPRRRTAPARPDPRRPRPAADRGLAQPTARPSLPARTDHRPCRDRRPCGNGAELRGTSGSFLRHVRLEPARPARPLPARPTRAGRLRLRLPVRPPAERAAHGAPHGPRVGPRRGAAAHGAPRHGARGSRTASNRSPPARRAARRSSRSP